MTRITEYVKLCIESERVNLAKKKRILKPVFVKGLNYPCDIYSNIKYIETKNGIIKDPGQDYVLSIIYEKTNDEIWKSKDVLENMIKNLHASFKQFGAPRLLEFLSPYRTPDYTDEKFFEKYQIFEKSMRRYTKMKWSKGMTSLVGGAGQKQHGVNIYVRYGKVHYIGILCKKVKKLRYTEHIL